MFGLLVQVQVADSNAFRIQQTTRRLLLAEWCGCRVFTSCLVILSCVHTFSLNSPLPLLVFRDFSVMEIMTIEVAYELQICQGLRPYNASKALSGPESKRSSQIIAVVHFEA